MGNTENKLADKGSKYWMEAFAKYTQKLSTKPSLKSESEDSPSTKKQWHSNRPANAQKGQTSPLHLNPVFEIIRVKLPHWPGRLCSIAGCAP